ncbi:hypothetical protein FQA47_018039 [Oryzias melastigma]|uniref:Uncharacterized protein n=1 Tax=Oryzias melastigma TaxID=30732 RepID=A0A834C5W1_ORYME|nr:hypothetical protein FQA47_018039 [Oryzias melastigma]
MAEKRKLGQSGAGGKGQITFKYFFQMEEILGQRPMVTSMASVINSMGDDDNGPDTPGTKDASKDSASSLDDESTTDAEMPGPSNTLEEEEREPQTPQSQQRWRNAKSRRSTLQSFLREQGRQDNAVLTTISEVLSRAVQCFERATEAAERHANALETLAGIRQPIVSDTRQQPPYFLQHPVRHQPQQPGYTTYIEPQHRFTQPPYRTQQVENESEPHSALSFQSTSTTYHIL